MDVNQEEPVLCSSPKQHRQVIGSYQGIERVGEGDVPPHGLSGDCCLVMEHTQLSFVACGDSQPCVF